MPGGGFMSPPSLKLKTENNMKTESDYLLMLCDVVAAMKKDMPALLAVTHDIQTDIDRIDYIELSKKSDAE